MWDALRVTPTAPPFELAGLKQRLLADLIDSGVGLGVLGGLAGIALERGRPDVLERVRRAKVAVERLGEWTTSPQVKRARSVVGVLWAVGMRNARGPGMRAAHIHRVDARTGGPVTVRSALRRVAFEWTWRAASKRLTDPMFEPSGRARRSCRPSSTRSAALTPTTRGPRPPSEHPRGRSRRVAAGVILLTTAIQELPRTFTSRRQNLTEWVAGIVVVRD